MPLPFMPTAALASYVVQAKTATGRQTFPARNAREALAKANGLVDEGRDVQVFSADGRLVALEMLRDIIAAK